MAKVKTQISKRSSNALYKKMQKGKNRKGTTVVYSSRPIVEVKASAKTG